MPKVIKYQVRAYYHGQANSVLDDKARTFAGSKQHDKGFAFATKERVLTWNMDSDDAAKNIANRLGQQKFRVETSVVEIDAPEPEPALAPEDGTNNDQFSEESDEEADEEDNADESNPLPANNPDGDLG